MGKKLIFEGKTPEDAVEKAIAETGVPVSELKFEILSHGGSGIFGLGLKKAKIEVTLPDEKNEKGPKAKEDKAKPKPEKAKEAKKEETKERPSRNKEPVKEEKTETAAPKKDEPEPVTAETDESENKPEAAKEQKNGPEYPKASDVNLDEIFNNSKGVKGKTSDGGWAQPSRQTELPKRKIKVRSYAELRGDMIMPDKVDIDLTDGEMERREKRKAERPKREKERSDSRSRKFDRDRKPDTRPDYDKDEWEEDDISSDIAPEEYTGEDDQSGTDRDTEVKVEIGETPITSEPPEGAEKEHLEIGQKIVVEFLEKAFPDYQLESGWREDKLYYNIIGDGSGLLIGRKGQTLDALQFLVNKMIDRKIGSHVRVMVDTEGYRGRREVSLQKQAEELGRRALRSGKPTITMPLNPHDRRIIHLALKESEVLKTRSRGNGTYKKVVISPK